MPIRGLVTRSFTAGKPGLLSKFDSQSLYGESYGGEEGNERELLGSDSIVIGVVPGNPVKICETTLSKSFDDKNMY